MKQSRNSGGENGYTKRATALIIGSGIEVVLWTGRNVIDSSVLRVLDLNIVRPVRERLHSRPNTWTTTSKAFFCILMSVECSVSTVEVRMEVLQVGLMMIERHPMGIIPVGWLTVSIHHCTDRRIYNA